MSSFGQTLTALVSDHRADPRALSGRQHGVGPRQLRRPNLQQIPRDGHFRALFVPEPGHALVVADYSSMELRAAAHIFGDRAMTEAIERAFEHGLDLHTITAARMTGKDPAAVTTEERKGAKPSTSARSTDRARGLVQAAWEKWDLVLDPGGGRGVDAGIRDSYSGLVRGRREHHQRCEPGITS